MRNTHLDVSRKVVEGVRRQVTYTETKEFLAKKVGIPGQWGVAPNLGSLIYANIARKDPYPIIGSKADVPCRGYGPCDATEDIFWESSRTAYHWNPNETPIDPNRPIPLCRECAEEHHGYWDDMWSDYYSGRL